MAVYVWYPILASLAVGFAFMNLPPLADDLMALYGVSYGGLSLLFSALLWAHSLFQIPSGLIIDKFGPYKTLVFSGLLAIFANLAPFLAYSSLALAISMRLVLGLCTCLNFLSVLKLIGQMAPKDQIAKLQGYQGGAFCLGTVLPYLCLSIGGGLSWKWAYLICAIMFVLVLAATPAIREKKPKSSGDSGVSNVSYVSGASDESSVSWAGLVRTAIPAILKSKEIWALGLLHGFSFGTLNNLGQWLPSILSERSGRPLAHWTTFTIIILLIGTLSRCGSGLILTLISKSAAIIGVVLSVAGLYLWLGLSGNIWLTLVLGIMLAALSGLNYGPIFNLGGLVMKPAYMGTALGFLVMVANLTNVALTMILGNGKDYTGSFQAGLILAGIMSIISLVIFGRTIRNLDSTIKMRHHT
ncbi:MAG: MFS transporter [Deltaproteobacteria bacterium]|jgi:MFS family permease|nr:MFS transporter [Deltaproteobacteria bacterium]